MIIFSGRSVTDKADIFRAEDDGKHVECLTSSFKLRYYHQISLSPDQQTLLFKARLPDRDEWPFFILDLNAQRLERYEKEPYPFVMRWLTSDRFLCEKHEQKWIYTRGQPDIQELKWAEGFLVLDISTDGSKLAMNNMPRAIGGNVFIGYVNEGIAKAIVHPGDFGKIHSILHASHWSTDGKILVCKGGYEDEIWLVNEDGTNPRKVAEGDYFWMDYHLSPDGKKIAFTRSKGPEVETGTVSVKDLLKKGAIFVKDLQTNQEDEIVLLDGAARKWTWSPDSRSLIHTQLTQDYLALYRTAISSKIVEVLIPNGEAKRS